MGEEDKRVDLKTRRKGKDFFPVGEVGMRNRGEVKNKLKGDYILLAFILYIIHISTSFLDEAQSKFYLRVLQKILCEMETRVIFQREEQSGNSCL